MASASDAQEEPPRDPGAYRPSIHFGARFKDNYDEHNRHLDGEIVRECIENGHVEHPRPGVVYFRNTLGGVTYRLVVDTVKREVRTGYPIGINPEAARASGRWSTKQIEDIRTFLAAK